MRAILPLRRDLGFKLKKHQTLPEGFASFLEQENTSLTSSRLALLWATQAKHIQPAERAARLAVIRGFARYWSTIDTRTEVPPDGLLPFRPALNLRCADIEWPEGVLTIREAKFGRSRHLGRASLEFRNAAGQRSR